ncbi:MAG: hypothetical protein FWE74_07570 [Oscillospiraceae bacterium]|nr:hypothetical protein [Oscillospiraceae bacterium]
MRKRICFGLIWLSIITAGFFSDIAFHEDVPEHIIITVLGICVTVMFAAYVVGEFWEECDETFK